MWLAGSLLAEGPVPRLAETAGGSTAVRTLALFLPPPTEIATGLGGWLDTTGLPDVFVGFEPLPAPPVDRPDDPAARAIAAAAEASTLKVSAATCGLSSVGTGFVVSPSYVLTNAHVVAGQAARRARPGPRPGPRRGARCCSIRPWTSPCSTSTGLRVTALRFAAQDPSRGALGATLGYPGGGRLTVVPAAVADRYQATGRDIYGTERVRREILELRAEIDRGDSGGPLILEDGTVGGVVFAEARTDPQVGYALAATEVWNRIRTSIGRTAATDTGVCTADH